jgi:hypothetical protein
MDTIDGASVDRLLLQSNLSIVDTQGTLQSVHFREALHSSSIVVISVVTEANQTKLPSSIFICKERYFEDI